MHFGRNKKHFKNEAFRKGRDYDNHDKYPWPSFTQHKSKMAITCDQVPFLFRGGNEKKGRLITGQNGQRLLSFQISPRCGVTGNFKTKPPFSKSAEITSSKTRAVFVTVLVTLSESEMRQPEIWSRNRNSNLKLISFAYVYLTLS